MGPWHIGTPVCLAELRHCWWYWVDCTHLNKAFSPYTLSSKAMKHGLEYKNLDSMSIVGQYQNCFVVITRYDTSSPNWFKATGSAKWRICIPRPAVKCLSRYTQVFKLVCCTYQLEQTCMLKQQWLFPWDS